MTPLVDVLIPTCDRPAALAVTLASLVGQDFPAFRVTVSDQSPHHPAEGSGEVLAVTRVLRSIGRPVRILRHLPNRGMAEQRAFLLSHARAPWSLFIDDDLVLEADVLRRMLGVMLQQRCGFVGMAPIGLSHAGDVRPHEQRLELWDGPVRPETIRPLSPEWERYTLHNAANLLHAQRRGGFTAETTRPYRVAWVGGCALYDTAKLRQCGGWDFWDRLPPRHAGEDVVVQLRLQARFGGCGVIPSGVYHQELPTTVRDRTAEAWRDFPELLEDLPTRVSTR